MQERIAAVANSLSERCLTCKAACCRAGSLVLESVDVPRFSRQETRSDTVVVTSLIGGCEHLINNQCAIYADRPQVCRDFPLFLRYKTLFVSTFCPATPSLELELKNLQVDFPELKIIMQ